MRILCIEPGQFTGDDLIPGMEYDCIPAEDGTDRQNKAWHSLLTEYWRSGCHSYHANNFLHFRELIKLNLGAGVERYYCLVSDKGVPLDIPVIKYRVKGWGRYTKKERKQAIDNLISEMIQAGVTTKKFDEILQGMEDRSLERQA